LIAICKIYERNKKAEKEKEKEENKNKTGPQGTLSAQIRKVARGPEGESEPVPFFFPLPLTDMWSPHVITKLQPAGVTPEPEITPLFIPLYSVSNSAPPPYL
jgi:hypothetical protein